MSDLQAAVDALNAGRLVVLPTDTVYGVAALPSVTAAVQAIFVAKGRPSTKPLPMLGPDQAALAEVATFDARARALADAFWPGPLTLVLPRAASFAYDLGGEDDGTIAVRVPSSPRTGELLGLVGPLAVTSANRSGTPAANTVQEAQAALGDAVAVYLDGGPGGGHASTVVTLVGEPEVLREGALPSADIMGML